MKKCIYILEDNDDIRELISFLLIEEDYEVMGYPTVKSFKQKMLSNQPDMIILDVMLPDGNGLVVCDELKSDQKTSSIPILIMSANSQAQEVKESCSAEDFISKPFDIDDLVKRVGRYLQ
jgi:DNA-binding response OmpR family regulator